MHIINNYSMETKMKKEPKISIIVPVYNAERYISKCLNSILSQTEKDFEVIIVDDGSKDRSLERCQYYENIDERVKVLHQENFGVSKARNIGIKTSKGKYITFVDVDDYIRNDYIEKLLEKQQKYNTDLVCTSYIIEKKFGRKNKIIYKERIIKKENIVNDFLPFFDSISTAPWGKLYKSCIIKNCNIYFPENIPYAEDTIFNIKYYSKINSIAISDDLIYFYNYKDSGSAVKKYYPDLCFYLYDVFVNKQHFFMDRKCQSFFYLKINIQQQYYFEWCMEHYIKHCKKQDELICKLKKTKELFILASEDETWVYHKYVKQEEWKNLICLWKKNNRKDYIKFLIKNRIGI